MDRRTRETLFKNAMRASLFLVGATFFALLAVVLYRGASAFTWALLFQAPRSDFYLGQGGGVANAILGSLCLAGGATLLALIVSLPAALALQKGFARPAFAGGSRLILDILWGTPSIVYGAIGFVVMMRLGIRASLLGGILALALVMLPIMIRGMDEALRMVPRELQEVPYGLGATRLEMVRAVLLRQAFPGILTAILLAMGRGLGDAASVLFTAGYTDNLPSSLMDPVASLPLAVFYQIGSPLPEVRQRAYACALILLLLILALNVASRLLERRFTRHTLR